MIRSAFAFNAWSMARRAALAALLFTAQSSFAIGCDELRQSIDARIRAGGMSSFSLTVVAADAAASGSVVGRCELGSKKIVYLKGVAAAPAPAAPATSAAKPKAPPQMITECDDGSTVTRGECRK